MPKRIVGTPAPSARKQHMTKPLHPLMYIRELDLFIDADMVTEIVPAERNRQLGALIEVPGLVDDEYFVSSPRGTVRLLTAERTRLVVLLGEAIAKLNHYQNTIHDATGSQERVVGRLRREVAAQASIDQKEADEREQMALVEDLRRRLGEAKR